MSFSPVKPSKYVLKLTFKSWKEEAAEQRDSEYKVFRSEPESSNVCEAKISVKYI